MDASVTRRGQPCWYRRVLPQSSQLTVASRWKYCHQWCLHARSGNLLSSQEAFQEGIVLRWPLGTLPWCTSFISINVDYLPNGTRSTSWFTHRPRRFRWPLKILIGKAFLHRHLQNCFLFILPPRRIGNVHGRRFRRERSPTSSGHSRPSRGILPDSGTHSTSINFRTIS